MRRFLTIALVVGVFAAGLISGYESGHAQTAAPLFVVYGTMTTEDGNPVEGVYTVVVENLRTGIITEGDVGEGENAGKYASVFIDYSGGNAVAVGDIINVSVRVGSNPVQGVSETREITIEDVLDMRVMIDIIEPDVAADSRTWGMIKSLYR